MKPLTEQQRDAFLDSAAIALYAANESFSPENAYTAAEALLAERDRRSNNPTA